MSNRLAKFLASERKRELKRCNGGKAVVVVVVVVDDFDFVVVERRIT